MRIICCAIAGLMFALCCVGCDREAESVRSEQAAASAPAEFVGGEVCATCHEDQARAWRGSHHQLAMQPATDATVLGNFADAEFTYGETTTRFFRRDGAFLVTTDGADGEPSEFEVSYTFGVEPLQQYLIESTDGRVQALGIAWDSRPGRAGGQRWFHLYPEEVVDHRDPLHWTGVYQRWNTMCADCHSTDFVKGYDLETDSFESRWSSVDVDCEACHGPGSIHAANPGTAPPALAGTDRSWVFQTGQAIAARVPAPGLGGAAAEPVSEPDVCARCHSRRTQLTDDYVAGDALLDALRPALLDAGLYHADGQIQDEVYVYGSFLQSRMARAGVVCSDCHDPHTAEIRAEGNALCTRCHLATVFDQPEHHRHEAGTAGAECTACHMRQQTYMVVDPRRDHSFRVPRPDLSTALDSPNACNDCHTGETSEWAAARIAEWYPDGRRTEPHFGQALAAGRSWAADGRDQLLRLIVDPAQPAIARATAVRLLADRLAPADVETLRAILDGDEPLLQLAAIEAAAALAPEMRVALIQRFLNADRLVLRTLAARALQPVREQLSARRQADLDAAIAEYLDVQRFNSDRPEGMLNLANFELDRGRVTEAEDLYREAIARYPQHPAIYVNLADLYRLTDRAEESEATLREGLAASPGTADLELALGFAIVRRGAPEEALAHFRSAAGLAEDDPYYSYVRAIAENDVGNAATALELLRATQQRFPGHGATLFALATMLRDAGDFDAARDYASRLVAVLPGDADALSLLRDLEQL